MKPAGLLLFASALVVAQPTATATKPNVFFIRHGEKPADDNVRGLSEKGKQRAQCLRTVFGAQSAFNIGLVVAQDFKPNGARIRAHDTVAPLAKDLGLPVNHSCDRDDPACVKALVESFEGPGNILICWEHKMLNDLAEELGEKQVDEYPSDAFNLILTDNAPYTGVVGITSQECPGLDN